MYAIQVRKLPFRYQWASLISVEMDRTWGENINDNKSTPTKKKSTTFTQTRWTSRCCLWLMVDISIYPFAHCQFLRILLFKTNSYSNKKFDIFRFSMHTVAHRVVNAWPQRLNKYSDLSKHWHFLFIRCLIAVGHTQILSMSNLVMLLFFYTMWLS